jgi:hypothetical protein
MLPIKSIVSPQHIIIGLTLLLTTSHRCELVIHQQAPEVGASLLTPTDSGNKEVVKLGGKGAIQGEVIVACCFIKSGSAGCAKGWVRAVVESIASMCASGNGRNFFRAAGDVSFENGSVFNFNSEEDCL